MRKREVEKEFMKITYFMVELHWFKKPGKDFRRSRRNLQPGTDLRSHTRGVQYYQRWGAWLPGSVWDRVEPPRYRHRDKEGQDNRDWLGSLCVSELKIKN